MSPIHFKKRQFYYTSQIKPLFMSTADKVTTQEGCIQRWRLLPSSSPLPNQNSKNPDFIDTMILKVLHDLPFSLNQPLKSVNTRYIRLSYKKQNFGCLR